MVLGWVAGATPPPPSPNHKTSSYTPDIAYSDRCGRGNPNVHGYALIDKKVQPDIYSFPRELLVLLGSKPPSLNLCSSHVLTELREYWNNVRCTSAQHQHDWLTALLIQPQPHDCIGLPSCTFTMTFSLEILKNHILLPTFPRKAQSPHNSYSFSRKLLTIRNIIKYHNSLECLLLSFPLSFLCPSLPPF